MKIIAIDEDLSALRMLTDAIWSVKQDAEVFYFSTADMALDCARERHCDIVFLTVQTQSMLGLEVAERMKEISPQINIIFVSASREFAYEAMQLHASGYIEKPLTQEKVRVELANLRYPIAAHMPQALLKITCFGNFNVCTIQNPGMPLHFERTKSKECFAYIVSRRGNPCTVRELAAILFEDVPYGAKQANYVQQIITSMMKTLRRAGVGKVIHKRYNAISVNPNLIDCDYYRFCAGEAAAVSSYHGEFMQQYPWAEFMIGTLK